MQVSIEKIINLYDGKSSSDRGHVSSITGLSGEDFAAGILKHYFDNNGGSCEILPDKPTEGFKKGKWLDRWLKVEMDSDIIYYQTEIKNWCSHSLGGKQIKLETSDDELINYGHQRFRGQWDTIKKTFKYTYVSKVLRRMKIAANIKNGAMVVKSLICYWYPILDTQANTLNPFFSTDCSQNFSEVKIFSLSIYLRFLLEKGVTCINIEMPNFEERLKKIKEIYEC